MICQPCCAAGLANSMGDTMIAIMLHQNCKNCECQHKTGQHWIKKDIEKPPTR